MAERTLIWDIFDYIFEADRRRIGRLPAGQAGIKLIRTYRNSVFLAREWQKALETGEYLPQAALARELGVSRVRVTQVLCLLRMAPEVLDKIDGFGDPLTSPIVTERKLRLREML